jgi:hypothetical protein
MPHSPFENPRMVMIAGVKYVMTVVSVKETRDDGEPKSIEIRRHDDPGPTTGFALVYLPATWSRGPEK